MPPDIDARIARRQKRLARERVVEQQDDGRTPTGLLRPARGFRF
jgi:hypothetical protein